MDIVLVRHGKAVELSYEPDDSKRELTKKGRKEIIKSIPYLKEKLNHGQKVLIWTSNASRALQTAQVIAKELDIDNILMFDFIYTGEYASFIDELKNIDDDTTLLVVGHEPYLSSWGKKMYDVRIPFRKGSMAGFKIINKAPLKAELIWLLHPSVRDTKKSLDNNDSNFMKKDYKLVMIDMIDEISDMIYQYCQYPEDIESVHQLRVSIRKTRSLLSFIKPILNGEEYSSYQSELKEIADRFSYIRELDVIFEQWKSILDKNKELSNCNALTEVLRREREKEKAELCDYVYGNSIYDKLNNVLHWIDSWDENVDSGNQFQNFIMKRFEKWNKDVVDAMKCMDYKDLDEIHSIRIKYKKIRYVQSNINLLNNNKFMHLSDLKSMQDNLGKICDTYVNISILQKLKSIYNTNDINYETGIFIGYILNYRKALMT
jgi:phosphohistidine phosphatase SixA